MTDDRFWEQVPLRDMSREQWESLCDGCGRCCLHKLEDEYSRNIYYTAVACRLLDPQQCRCTRYGERKELVPECIVLSPEHLGSLSWLPDTCAYRLLDEGRPLHDWHPLVSGDPDSVHDAGISVRGRTLSEEHVHEDDYEECVVKWISPTRWKAARE
jgi:uncharacterized cysteine cluster protein YcgN (CxxCxxCC family)